MLLPKWPVLPRVGSVPVERDGHDCTSCRANTVGKNAVGVWFHFRFLARHWTTIINNAVNARINRWRRACVATAAIVARCWHCDVYTQLPLCLAFLHTFIAFAFVFSMNKTLVHAGLDMYVQCKQKITIGSCVGLDWLVSCVDHMLCTMSPASAAHLIILIFAANKGALHHSCYTCYCCVFTCWSG